MHLNQLESIMKVTYILISLFLNIFYNFNINLQYRINLKNKAHFSYLLLYEVFNFIFTKQKTTKTLLDLRLAKKIANDALEEDDKN
jgi:hypothetical protein